MDLVRFSCECRLLALQVRRLNENAVSGYFRPVNHLDDVTDNEFSGGNGHGLGLTASIYGDFLAVHLFSLQFLELHLVAIVVNCVNERNHSDCKEN